MSSYALLDMDMTVAAEEVRGMTMVHNVNGELFHYNADDAEDVQRFAAIQWKMKILKFSIFYWKCNAIAKYE